MGSRCSYKNNEAMSIALTSQLIDLWNEYTALVKEKLHLPDNTKKTEYVRIALDIALSEHKQDVINVYKKRYANKTEGG